MKKYQPLATVIILVLFLLLNSPVQAAYNTGYYFPWKNGGLANLTQLPSSSGHINQIDFVIGGTSLNVTDRQKQNVVAVKAGIIVFARDDSTTSCNLAQGQRCDDKANLVVIKHPGSTPTYSWYWHLAPGSIPSQFKKVGTPVRHGEVIAKQGKTGTISTTTGNGVHLHFFVSKGYGAPASGKRLPSASSIISVSFVNNTNTYLYSGLKIQQYTSYNNPVRLLEIKSAVNNYCLDLTDGNNSNGTKIQLWYDCVKNNNQKWEVTIASPSVYLLRNPLTNSQGERLCIDVTDGNNSLPVQVWGCSSSNLNQRWQLVPIAEGVYQIKNTSFGCLAPANSDNRSQVVIKSCNSSDAYQKWKIYELSSTSAKASASTLSEAPTLTATVTPTLMATATYTATLPSPTNTPTITESFTATPTNTLELLTPTITSTETPSPSVTLYYFAPTLTPSYTDDSCTAGWFRVDGWQSDFSYLTLNKNQTTSSIYNTATYSIKVDYDGYYRISNWVAKHLPVEWSCSSNITESDSTETPFRISHANGESVVYVNQSQIIDDWVSVGEYYFVAGTTYEIIIFDLNSEMEESKTISVGTLKVEYIP